jgi:putative spermidine/putrescine transport system ATP-binding protein
VGVSNLISGAAAQAITGSPDTFSIRPEKIRILAPGASAPGGACTAAGTLRDVIYLGMYTRYLVSLEGSIDLVVMEQNRDTSTVSLQSARGSAVRLTWDPAHNRRLAPGG